jgi:protein associated with RNAse G/E
MLFPSPDGSLSCETTACEYKTTDLFEFLDHCGVEFTWDVKVTPKHSFDLFHFLELLSDEESYQLVQDVSFLFVNAASDELDDFIEESIVAVEANDGIKNIERMLRENGSK